MAICVRLWNGRDDVTGTRYTDALRLDAGGNPATCGYLLISGPEWQAAQNQTGAPIWEIDEAGGALIAAAVLGVWALGWVFAKLIRTLQQN